ncbi:MAG: phosphoribosylanthranilate isomerase [bacterium]
MKICGLTSESDALLCLNAGADALGFNFYRGSKRFLDPRQSLEWIRQLEGQVDRVAVVVNADASLLGLIRDSHCFEFVQFHGDESPSDCFAACFPSWIRAVRVRDDQTLDACLEYASPHILLDAWSPEAYGGTGQVADWRLLADFVSVNPSRNFALAGGLTPSNVGEAIRIVKPRAVDVAGGVESSPGKKDARLVKEFIEAARRPSRLDV